MTGADVLGEEGKWSEAAVRDKEGTVPSHAQLLERCGKKTPPLRRTPGSQGPQGRARSIMCNEEEKGTFSDEVWEAGDVAEF